MDNELKELLKEIEHQIWSLDVVCLNNRMKLLKTFKKLVKLIKSKLYLRRSTEVRFRKE